MVVSTETSLDSLTWHFVVAVDSDEFELASSDLNENSGGLFLAFENNATDHLVPFDSNHSITIPVSTEW